MLHFRRSSIRHGLLVFAAALLTPGLILAAVLFWQFARAEQNRYEDEARATSLRVISAVDRELASIQAAAQALATSGSLQEGNYEVFHKQALASLRAWSPDRPEDFALVVRDATGQQVVNTRLPWGAPLPRGANPQIDQDVIETKRPYIQDLFTGASAGRPIVSVRVPVLRDGEVTHVLSMALEPQRIANLFAAQALPPGWVATVVDRADRVVARSRDHAAFLGKVAPDEFRSEALGDLGVWRGRNLEGIAVMGAYARSGLTGWRAFIGVPAQIVQAPLERSLWILGILSGLLIGTSVVLALWFGRRIAASVHAVSTQAKRLGQGEPVGSPATGLIELDEVATALETASTELQQRELDLRQSESRLRATHENAAVGIVEVDQDGMFVSVNEARCRLTGHAREELVGAHFGHSTYANDLSRDLELFAQQVAGELDRYTVENQFTHKNGSRGWVRVSSTAVRDASGAFLYAVRIVEDITERKKAEERQKLLIDELNHRVKNTLATVQSLAWQSTRHGDSPQRAQERFQERLLALSRTHNLLNETSWEGATLRSVVAAELEPYAGQPGRVRFEGPNVGLSPKTAVVVGMALHELATNAVKYGSLSTGAGQLRVTWEERSSSNGRLLVIDWCEHGGAPVATPQRTGFGTRLIRQVVTSELMGTLDLRFEAEGVCCVMQIPLEEAPLRAA